jgi:hypothetical protein
MTQKKWSDKIPVTIGVIGTSDGNIKDHLIKIQQLLTDVTDACPNSPVYLFSSIQSSDRIIARNFLDLKIKKDGDQEKFELIVVTSRDGDSIINETDKEINDLLLQAKRKIILNCGGTNDEPKDYSEISKFIRESSLIVYDFTKLSGKSITDTPIRQALEKIEEINSDTSRIDQDSFAPYYLVKDPEALDEQQKFILNAFSQLDRLSIYFHNRYSKTVIWLFITGLLTVIAFGIYTNVWLSKIMLTIAIFLIAVAGSIYYYSRKTKDHSKYLYNRTLAEAIRIQFYWNITGINFKVSDYILRIHRKEFAWIEYILASVYGVAYNNESKAAGSIKDVTTHWFKDQADFFDSSIGKMNIKLFYYKLISNISFITALGLLFSIFFLEKIYTGNNLMNWLQVLIGTLLSIFALTRAFIQMKGYTQLLNQYELMSDLYQEAEARIAFIYSEHHDQNKRLRYIRELFFMIGRESLIENGNWYMILKEKEPGIEGI